MSVRVPQTEASMKRVQMQDACAAELVEILNFYRDDREEFDKRGQDAPLQVMTWHEIMNTAEEPLWKRRLDQVRTDPVRTVLKARVREIGWKLYAAGGLTMMSAVCDLVDMATLGRPGGAILDKWWDGLGIWDKDGVWCA